jgi:hypothetical protein
VSKARSNSRLVWALVAVQLALGTVSTTGLEVCIGAAGHLEIERAHMGVPCHPIEGGTALSSGCIDTPLFLTPLARSRSVDQPQDFPELSVVAVSVPSLDVRTALHRTAALRSRAADPGTAFRTGSVLLIV